MNLEALGKIVQQTKEAMDKLLNVKGGEYANSDDRLANFKRGAALTGVTPLQVLFVYLSKHYDGVASFIRKSASGESLILSEPIEGRLDDIIVYCTLAKALLKEARTDEALEHDRDFYEHRDRIPRERDFGEIRPTMVRIPPHPGDERSDHHDVHGVVSTAGVLPASNVQSTPPVAHEVENPLPFAPRKAGGAMCISCAYADLKPTESPCNTCVEGVAWVLGRTR